MNNKNHTHSPSRLIAALMSAFLLGSTVTSSLVTCGYAVDASESTSSVSVEPEVTEEEETDADTSESEVEAEESSASNSGILAAALEDTEEEEESNNSETNSETSTGDIYGYTVAYTYADGAFTISDSELVTAAAEVTLSANMLVAVPITLSSADVDVSASITSDTSATIYVGEDYKKLSISAGTYTYNLSSYLAYDEDDDTLVYLYIMAGDTAITVSDISVNNGTISASSTDSSSALEYLTTVYNSDYEDTYIDDGSTDLEDVETENTEGSDQENTGTASSATGSVTDEDAYDTTRTADGETDLEAIVKAAETGTVVTDKSVTVSSDDEFGFDEYLTVYASASNSEASYDGLYIIVVDMTNSIVTADNAYHESTGASLGTFWEHYTEAISDLVKEISSANSTNRVCVIGFSTGVNSISKIITNNSGTTKSSSSITNIFKYNPSSTANVILPWGNYASVSGDVLTATTGSYSTSNYAYMKDWSIGISSAAYNVAVSNGWLDSNTTISDYKRTVGNGTFTAAAIEYAATYAKIFSATYDHSDRDMTIILYTDGVPTVGNEARATSTTLSYSAAKYDNGGATFYYDPANEYIAKVAAYSIYSMSRNMTALESYYASVSGYSCNFDNQTLTSDGLNYLGMWLTGIQSGASGSGASAGSYYVNGSSEIQITNTSTWPANRADTWYSSSHSAASNSIALDATSVSTAVSYLRSNYTTSLTSPFKGVYAYTAKSVGDTFDVVNEALKKLVKTEVSVTPLAAGTYVTFDTTTTDFLTVQGTPTVLYRGVYYSPSSVSATYEDTVTYTYNIADISSAVVVTVTTSDYTSTVEAKIKAELVNTNALADEKAGSINLIRIKFHTSLFSDDLSKVYSTVSASSSSSWDADSFTLTAYTNDYSDSKTTVTYTTDKSNSASIYQKTNTITTKKTDNATGTLSYISYEKTGTAGKQTTVTLGNNGKLVLTLGVGDLELDKTVTNLTSVSTPLSGFTFTLSGTSLIGADVEMTATTDETGKITFEDVPVGTNYTVTEVSTPDGSDAIPSWWDTVNAVYTSVTVAKGATTTLTPQNIYKSGNVVVQKSIETADSLGVSAEYNATSEANYHYNTSLYGFVFHLTGTSDSGIAYDLYATTDANGYAYFDHLPVGTYTVEEITASEFAKVSNPVNGSEDHKLDATQELYQYVIPDAKTVTVTYDETTHAEVTTTISFKNVLKKWYFSADLNALALTKYDQDTQIEGMTDYDQGDAVLEGAVYGLYDDGKLVATATTDANGNFTFVGSNGYFIVGDKWYIQEISPSEGYNLDTTKYAVNACAVKYLTDNVEYFVALTETTVKGAATGEYGGADTVSEDEITQPLAIYKLATDGSATAQNLSGAHFTVYLRRELDDFIAVTSYKTTQYESGTQAYYTDFFRAVSNGEVTITDADTYNSKFANVPSYNKAENGNLVVFSVSKESKYIQTKVPVATKYVDGVGPTEIADLVTDSDGYAYSEALNYGDYVVYETVVPEAQLAAAEAYTFSIEGNKQSDGTYASTTTPKTLGFYILDSVTEMKMELVKVDSDTGKSVLKANTQYVIYEVEDDGSLSKYPISQQDSTTHVYYGTVDNPWVSDENGVVTLLEPLSAASNEYTGNYYIAEINAVSGYYNEYVATGTELTGAYFTVDNSLTYERRYYLASGNDAYTTDPSLDEDEYLHSGNNRVYDDVVVISYTNPETRGQVTIEKTGEELAGYGASDWLTKLTNLLGFTNAKDFWYEETTISGAVYQITAAEDIYTQDNQGTLWASAGDVIATVTTGTATSDDVINISCNGIVTTSHDSEGRVTVTLPLGKYTITEVQAPAGYTLNSESKTVEFVWDSQTQQYVLDSSGTADKDGVVSFYNERVTGVATLTKTDSSDGSAMRGVVFGLYTADDIYAADGTKILSADSLIGYVETDENGVATTEFGLPIAYDGSLNTGRYYFVEAATPTGYYENTTKYEFSLSYVDQLTATVVAATNAENTPIPPELSIVKKVDKDVVQVSNVQDGECDLTYTITVTNDEGKAKNAYVTDYFNEYVTFTSARYERVYANGGAAFIYDFTESDSKEVATYEVDGSGKYTFYLGDIAEGDTVTITVTAHVKNTTAVGTEILNKAYVDATNNYADPEDPTKGTDPKESNEVETDVIGPILSIVKEQILNDGERTKQLVTAKKGDIITYYLTVTNSASATSDAYDVVVTDPIPDYVTYVDGTASDSGTYNADTKTLTWDVGTLAIGASKEVSFQVEVTTDAYNVNWTNIGYATASNADRCQDDVDDDSTSYKLIIHYVDTEGNTLWKDYNTTGTAGSTYDVTTLIYESIGSEYTIVGTGTYGNYTTTSGITEDSSAVTGTYDNDKEITVVYQKSDTETPDYTVTVHYVDTEGNPLRPDYVDLTGGDTYDETSVIYTSIGDYDIVGTGNYGNYTTTDGITNTSDPTSGTLDSNKEITVVYQKTEDDLYYTITVHYVDTEGHALQADYTATGAANSAYDMTEQKDATIGDYTVVGTGEFGNYTTTEGVSTANDTISGTLDSNKYIVIVYDKEDATTPTDSQKTVVVHYVDTEGNTIAADVVKVDETGAEYDVTSEIPETIGDYEIVGTGDYGKYTTTDGITNDSDSTKGTLDTDKVITVVYQEKFIIPSNPTPGEVKEPNVIIEKYQSRNGGEFTTSQLGVNAGDVVTYKLVVTNTEDAGADAYDVVITDPIPEGLTLVEGSISDGGTEADGVITWPTISTLAIGESVEVTFQVAVPESAANTTYTNIGYTTNGIPPEDPENPEPPIPSTPVEIVVGGPNVMIAKYQAVNDGEKTQELQQVLPGDVVTYYIQVSNPSVEGESTGAANNVTITDAIPDNLTLVEGSISDNGTEADGVISWTIETIPVDGAVEVSFQVTVPAVTETATYTNVAVVAVPDPETPDEPGTPIETNEVVVEEPIPDVTVAKTQAVNGGEATTDQVTVKPGDVITYYVTATNSADSPVAMTNMVITDEIPDGLTLVEDSISDDGTETDGVISWTIDTIEIGESVTVSFKVTVPEVDEETTYTNVAQYTSPYTPKDDDGNPIPEDTNEVEAVEPIPELSITKSQSVNNGTKTTSQVTVVANDVITYYVTVTNDEDSPVAASDVVITDEIPSGLTLVSGSISDDGTADNGEITWEIDTLDVGESVTVSFKVKVPSVSKSTTYTNVAQFVSSATPSPKNSNKVVAKQTVVSVKTGDNTSFLMFGLLGAALVLAAGCVVYLVKRRKANN